MRNFGVPQKGPMKTFNVVVSNQWGVKTATGHYTYGIPIQDFPPGVTPGRRYRVTIEPFGFSKKDRPELFAFLPKGGCISRQTVEEEIRDCNSMVRRKTSDGQDWWKKRRVMLRARLEEIRQGELRYRRALRAWKLGLGIR